MHTVSLADAERDGLVVDRSRLLALVGGDARVFGEAYECKFLDGDLQYFPTPLVDAARHWIGRTPDLSGAELYAGLDVGRHHDLTVLTIVAVVGGVAWVVAVLTAKRTAFKAQRKLLFEAREKLGWTKLVVDKSGLGEQFAEELVELWGEDEVIPIAFTAPMKAVLATGAFQWLQRGAVRFPKGEEGRRLHEETVAVRRIVTPAGNVTYVSPRTLEGHGDRAWSLFCALFAASGAEIPRGMGDEPLFAVA
jgi:phage FluMu gp28-like protein